MKELRIQNYKSLKDLELRGLDKVNLITGRNNTGKSSVLEAISLLTEKGRISWIKELLAIRNDLNEYYYSDLRRGNAEFEFQLLQTLFPYHCQPVDLFCTISIASEQKELTLRFATFVQEFIETDPPMVVTPEEFNLDTDLTYDKLGLEIVFDSHKRFYATRKRFLKSTQKIEPFKTHYIDSHGLNATDDDLLWDRVTLTPKEQLIIDALRIIEPSIERLSYINNNSVFQDRTPVVKLKDGDKIYPLNTMGDGIQRVLGIVLALVNSEGSCLLIDEFENGLHYSVQEDLWKIIFQIANKLNVQVFATTHSQDSIRSFASVLHMSEDYSGSLYRLDRKGDEIRSFLFTEEEIKEAARQEINLR